ncbi:SitI3 family protein [Actinoplanes xinjiangensis]|uniref:Uncharacterized protein n=1 Tax=Actinoplanes xinjiangensis TaxID=512350 RepID=A0A316FS29_9ACTN|nr:SitI3 family protein [Actinoplanes xinjiangensis]PWK51561.1 hypothetical protein BC793_102591 [Actinoplanes xinjiangensis]GIF35922.1 hypothetical protein Axi01nite_02330 [Actinoplanes xinjiangensis]
MSLDYTLTLASGATAAQIAARMPPEQPEWTPGTGSVLTADLYQTLGIDISLWADRHGYVDAMSDEGLFEWEPDPLVTVIFNLDGPIDREQAAANMIKIVHGLLESGPEDATLVINGDLLLVARFDGKIAKHNRERWWSAYPAADRVIPG